MLIEVDGTAYDGGRQILADGIRFKVYDTGQFWPKTGRRIYDVYDDGGPDLGCWRVLVSSFEEMLGEICERLGEIEFYNYEEEQA